ncbi:MAG: hypothetical protein IPP02_12260 [Chitinophagaceae bacterium]|nr:hypothetical protein [Chitinophagaceae bacterium]
MARLLSVIVWFELVAVKLYHTSNKKELVEQLKAGMPGEIVALFIVPVVLVQDPPGVKLSGAVYSSLAVVEVLELDPHSRI